MGRVGIVAQARPDEDLSMAILFQPDLDQYGRRYALIATELRHISPLVAQARAHTRLPTPNPPYPKKATIQIFSNQGRFPSRDFTPSQLPFNDVLPQPKLLFTLPQPSSHYDCTTNTRVPSVGLAVLAVGG